MTTSLHPCTACNRHIKSTESACPFCGAAAPVFVARAAAPRGRLSRAAILALGTLAAATPLSACGGESESEDPDEQGDGDGDGDGTGGTDGTGGIDGEDGSGGSAQAVYGAPATGGVDGSGGSDPVDGTGGDAVGPVYGAPAEPQ